MYKHILIPTDGSRLAAKGIRAGVQLAKRLKARVSGVYVIQPYIPQVYGEAAMYIPAVTPQEFKAYSQKRAKKVLAAVEQEARRAGVRCATQSVIAAQPWEGILRVARIRKCDTISMSSHGRSGLGGLLLGSQTSRVLAHSKIPVLVTR